MVSNSWQARFWWCAPDKRKVKRRRKWHMHEVYPIQKYNVIRLRKSLVRV